MSTQIKHLLRIAIPIFATVILLFGVSGALLAADFRSGETITIAQGQTIDDDLVLTGNTIIVDGTVNGDLIAIGGDVTVNGIVNGSLLVGARSLTMNGAVGGSLYNGGAMLMLGAQSKIERNSFFGGYSFEAKPGSVIGRDAMIGAYQALLNGEIQRDVRADLAALQINGRIVGDVNTNVGSPQDDAIPPFFLSFTGQTGGQSLPPALNPGIHIGSDARIMGKLNYQSAVAQPATILGEPTGGVSFTPAPVTTSTTATSTTAIATPATTQETVLSWLWVRLRELVTLLVLGALALWLLPKWFERASDNAWHEPLTSTGWGFVVTVVGYILAILAVILLIVVTVGLSRLTLAGLASSFFFGSVTLVGTAFTLFTLLIAYGSKLVVAYPFGHWLMSQMSASQAEKRAWPLLVGVLLYVLVRGIPYIGFVVGLFVTMIGIGAMWLIFRNRPKAAAVSTRMAMMPT